jgi:hypothetical protein
MSQRLLPILKINRKSCASVLGRAYAIDNGMSGDTKRFSAPNPPLAVLQQQIDKVEAAEKQARSGAQGAAAVRNLARDHLVQMLEDECAYVKTLCDASPEEAQVIIQAAGMECAAPRIVERSILKVKRGAASGTVDLDAAVALLAGRNSKGKVFNWQWTADGGKTFNDAPATPSGKTTLQDLPALAMLGFRVRVTNSDGPGEWSPTVSIVVH